MSSVKDKVQMFGILLVLKVIYQHILRGIIKKAIDDPETKWDNTLMEILDRLFDCQENVRTANQTPDVPTAR